jgi:hypothetical protein
MLTTQVSAKNVFQHHIEAFGKNDLKILCQTIQNSLNFGHPMVK